MPSILPASRIAPALRRERIRDVLMRIAKQRQTKLSNIIDVHVDMLITDLRNLTPKDTGAGAGSKEGAVRDLYRGHPAKEMGLPIGNFEGASGWQPHMKVSGTHWAVINPMWDKYLVYRNYMATTDSHFLERAMTAFRARLRNALERA